MFIKIINLFLQWINPSKIIQGTLWVCLFIAGYFFKIYFVGLAFIYGIYFFIGKMFGSMDRKEKEYINKCLAYILLVLLIGSILYDSNTGVYFSKFLIGASVSMIILFFLESCNPKIKWTEKIGRYSMIPYVTHGYFVVFARVILLRLGVSELWIYTIIETLFCFCSVYIVILIIERFPVLLKMFYPLSKHGSE